MGSCALGVSGVGATLEAQLDGIALVQLRIREAVESDQVAELDEMVAEKGARLEALLTRLLRQQHTPPETFARLSLLLSEDESLAGLIRRRLMVLRNELRRSSEAAQLVQGYARGSHSPANAEPPTLGNMTA